MPNSHPHTNAGDFPDATVSAAGSYCRDPGGIKGQPWCFTTTAETWDYCGVQVCSCKKYFKYTLYFSGQLFHFTSTGIPYIELGMQY